MIVVRQTGFATTPGVDLLQSLHGSALVELMLDEWVYTIILRTHCLLLVSFAMMHRLSLEIPR